MTASQKHKASGFTLTHSTPVDELNLTLHVYRHRPTGARYLHIECDDDNNLFGIGFKTTPHDSTGVAHILEHTVLCGSRNYPVRDPFFSMLKRSLNTFMNALTASDWTLYPFATRNRTDFYNLMGVYLDAVFFPLLREEDFRQEGHRLEFAEPLNPQSPLEIKGIVYNEMKGAMADPSSLLARRLNRALFPTLTYGHNSGGEPAEIPSLDYQGLRDFHARYYHPSNSYLCSYGNLPVEQHFAFIEQHALKHFSHLDPGTDIPREKRYDTPQHVKTTYPIDPGTPSSQRSLVQTGWLAAPIEDQQEIVALNVLASLLIGNPSAPLYKELLDCGLGLNLAPGTGYHDDIRETFFAAGLQGTDPERAEAIEGVILKTLSSCAEQGFSQTQIDTALHQLEFSFREVGGDSYPYGLTLLMRLFASWIHNDDPVTPMMVLNTYDKLRHAAHADGTFQALIHKHLLDNPHRVTLTLAPDSALKAHQEQAQRRILDKRRRDMRDADVQETIARAEALQRSQENPGDIEALPTLELEDIPKQEPAVDGVLTPLGNVPCWRYDQPTNGIVYLYLRFDLATLDEDLAPFLPLFCTLLPQVGAAGQDYLAISQRIAAYTGGIRASAQVIDQVDKEQLFTSCLEVRGKSLYRNSKELLKLIGELLSSADFEDHQRLHKVINQLCISLENGIPAAGHSYAMRLAAAHLSPAGRLKETWNGVEQLRLIRDWAGKKPGELGPLSQRLKQIAHSLVNGSHLRMHVTA